MSTRDRADWILTYTGRQFYPLNPTAAAIDIEDIAHALAAINRYNGHSRVPISVAQHSVMVSHRVPPGDALWGLLHDAAEAYLGDCVSPLKHHTSYGRDYQVHEGRLMAAICHKFGLPLTCPSSVLRADHEQFQEEWKWLMDPSKRFTFKGSVETWEFYKARSEFMDRFLELTRAH